MLGRAGFCDVRTSYWNSLLLPLLALMGGTAAVANEPLLPTQVDFNRAPLVPLRADLQLPPLVTSQPNKDARIQLFRIVPGFIPWK